MTEWASALMVFWVLWLVDGLKLPPSERFGVTGRGQRARLWYARLIFPGWNPAAWRTVVADIPFTLSPAGICNRPAGSAGRPVEAPARAAAWAWADVRETGVKGGWILINGARFCRDTGHLGARQILGLARLDEKARLARIAWLLHRWVRPAHLRRRARVLAGRTSMSAWCNILFLGLAAAITVYLASNAANRIPPAWVDALARALPLLAGYLLLLHLMAMVAAWRAVRRLKVAGEDKRTVGIFSAALLPPQALRLRGLTGEGWFPAQHPLAHALAFARKPELAALAFQTLGDMRWPLGEDGDPPLAREIVCWHRAALAEKLGPLLAAAGITEAGLFQAPRADGPDSRRYCPRCGSQFATEAERCPHGVGLEPVAPAKP